MSSTHTPNEDYTAPGQADEWTQVQQVIRELTRQRDRLAKANRLYTDGQGDDIDPISELQSTKDALRKAIPDLAARMAPDDAPVDMLVRDLVARYWDQVKKRKNTVTTGIKALDDILSGGLESQRLVTVLGAPNTGKTTFVHQLADHVACGGRPVFYVTSEDTPSALFAKTLARIGKIPYTAVLKGWETERARINDALAAQMDRQSIDRLRYLDATNGVTSDVIEVIREKAHEHFTAYPEEKGGGPGVLIIDYLQRLARALAAATNKEMRFVVGKLTSDLRALAMQLDCTVITIASQNRGGYERGASGSLATAKESGEVEYDCDVLMALTEDKDKNRVPPRDMTAIMLHIDKNRQGQKDRSVALDFWPDCQQFTAAE